MIGTRVTLPNDDLGVVLSVRGHRANVLLDSGIQVHCELGELSKTIQRVDAEICNGMAMTLSEHAFGTRLFAGDIPNPLMKKAAKDLAQLYRKSNGVKDLGVLLARETTFFKPNPDDAELATRYGRKLARMALGFAYAGMDAALVIPKFGMTTEPVTWRGVKPVRPRLQPRRPLRQRKR